MHVIEHKPVISRNNVTTAGRESFSMNLSVLNLLALDVNFNNWLSLVIVRDSPDAVHNGLNIHVYNTHVFRLKKSNI